MNRYRSTKVHDGMKVTKETQGVVLEWLDMFTQPMETEGMFLYATDDGSVSIMGHYGQFIFRNPDGSLMIVDGYDFENQWEDVTKVP